MRRVLAGGVGPRFLVTVPPLEGVPNAEMVRVSPGTGMSASVSFARTSSELPEECSFTVKASATATGASFTFVTVTVTVAVAKRPPTSVME